MTLFAVGHEKLMVPSDPSQKVESLKARYKSSESKVTSYEGESSRICQCLDQIASSFG